MRQPTVDGATGTCRCKCEHAPNKQSRLWLRLTRIRGVLLCDAVLHQPWETAKLSEGKLFSADKVGGC